ncbi:MAG: hypothetical protein K0S18_1781 [Anaerocolumna sp.]|nr:hypothetical protein [Anaerocolumna sp.]
MMNKNIPDEIRPGINVDVKVDVACIIKYMCLAAVLIVGIIFGSKCIGTMIKKHNESNL